MSSQKLKKTSKTTLKQSNKPTVIRSTNSIGIGQGEVNITIENGICVAVFNILT